MKIDLVYLWCDGSDENWLKEKQYYQAQSGQLDINATDNSRFVQHDELKFSLRSVELYMPWINHIFIVTNGQIPQWLDTNNSKISIVTHKEIMPADALPTFNSNAIEACIPNIPNLSEHFLYANDDMFISGSVEEDFFFASDGRPYVFLNPYDITESSLYSKQIHYVQNLIKEKYGKYYPLEPHHNIDAYRLSDVKKCIEAFKDKFDKTAHQRFREQETMQRAIWSYYALAHECGILALNRVSRRCHPDGKKVNPKVRISQYFDRPSDVVDRLNQSKLFCINDGENLLADERMQIKWILASIFPFASSFEKMIKHQWKYQVSVIVPVFNAERYLRRCLDSLINQSLQNIEIICVNDGSDDGSLQILREYAAADERIKILSFEKIGPGGCRNVGIDAAQGEYICFVDADDYVEKDTCCKSYTKIKESMAQVLSFNVLEILPHGIKKGIFFGGDTEKEIVWTDIVAELFDNRLCCWHLLISHNYLNYQNFYFSANRYYGEEMLFMVSLLLSAPKIKLLPDFFYHYCRNNTSLIAKDMSARLQFLNTVAELKRVLNTKACYKVLKDGFNRWCCKYAVYVYDDLSENLAQRQILCKGLQHVLENNIYNAFKKNVTKIFQIKILGLPLFKATEFDIIRKISFCGIPLISIKRKK